MKIFSASVLLMSALPALSAGFIKDFNYQVSDVATLGMSKEVLFEKMERKMLNLETSICANRAHLWAYDFLRMGNIKTGKIFIFFGSSIWTDKDKHGYMYHVAPYIVENGNEYVMEASYNDISKPMTVEEWIENETYSRVKGSDCVEITAADTDLTAFFYERKTLPEKRESGKQGARCYIRKVPGYYWFPASIAYHDLKKTLEGAKIDFDPKDFDKDDVKAACAEAASTKFGRLFGGGKDKCATHLAKKLTY